MTVPKAAMNLNNRAMFRKHDIRLARQSRRVQPEAEPGCMESSAEQHLGLGILPPNAAHIEPALFRCEHIHFRPIPLHQRRSA